VAQTLLSVLVLGRIDNQTATSSSPNYSKYLRRKFAELKFCGIMPAAIQSAGRLRSTI
jgi:hypothetical protein